MRRPNHASRFEGIAKTNLQASRASDTETLQSQVNKAAKKRLSLSGLEILHGRLISEVSRGRGHTLYTILPTSRFLARRADLLPNYLSQRLIDLVLPARSGSLKVIKNVPVNSQRDKHL